MESRDLCDSFRNRRRIIVGGIKCIGERAGSTVVSYLASPWLYLYGLTGFGTFVIMQFAFKTGEMVLIGPIQTSFNIIYPVLCSYLIFGAPVEPDPNHWGDCYRGFLCGNLTKTLKNWTCCFFRYTAIHIWKDFLEKNQSQKNN